MSLTTGEVFFTHTDARVGEIEITRTYNSARATDPARFGVLGSGWNMSHETRLRVLSSLAPKSIEIRLSDGTPIYYVVPSPFDPYYRQELPASSDSWIAPTQNGFTRVFRRGGSETYESSGIYGRLTTITDPAGHTTTYQHDPQDPNGRVTSITREGRTVTLTYDAGTGKLSQLRGPNNQLLASYGYDHDRLERVDYPATPPNVLAGGYRFAFRGASTAPDALIESVTDAAGHPIEKHLYDPATDLPPI